MSRTLWMVPAGRAPEIRWTLNVCLDGERGVLIAQSTVDSPHQRVTVKARSAPIVLGHGRLAMSRRWLPSSGSCWVEMAPYGLVGSGDDG